MTKDLLVRPGRLAVTAVRCGRQIVLAAVLAASVGALSRIGIVAAGSGLHQSPPAAKAAFADPRAGQGPQGRGVTFWLSGKPFPLPSFSVTGLNRRTVTSSEWRSHVVLLNFWATWCVPCRQEIHALLELQTRYRRRLLIVGLSVDEGPTDKVKQFAAEHHITYPVAIADERLQDRYGGLPKLPAIRRQSGRRDCG